MAATKRQMNWTAVSFYPTGGSALTATGVTSCSIDLGGSLVKFSGDGDRGPSTVVNDFNEPMVKITTADIAWATQFAPGTVGVLTLTHNDAKLATVGAIVYTMTPAVVQSPSNSGQHRQIGSADIDFVGVFSDGQTNPLSFTRA